MTAREPVSSKLFLALFFAAYAFLAVFDDPISGADEPRVAATARQMAVSGDFLVPRLHGEPFLEYPSLGYVPYALHFLFSERPSDFLLHLVPALFGLGTVWFTYRMGVLLGGKALGVAAALALATTFGFAHFVSKVLVDPILVFFITMSLWGFLAAAQEGSRGVFWPVLAFYGGMSLGFLSKGLIGLAVPGAVAFVDLVFNRERAAWKRLRPLWGAGIVVLVLGGWSLWVANRYGGEILGEFAWQSIWRFASSQADHYQPFYTYLGPLGYILLPWSLLFLGMLAFRWRSAEWRAALRLEKPQRFPAVWFLTVLLALSIASAKRNLYLAPLFPAFGLLAGIWWLRAQSLWKIGERATRWALFAGLAGMFGIRQVAVLPQEKSETWVVAMTQLAEDPLRDEIVLFVPSEGLSGAFFLHFGRDAIRADSTEDLSRLLQGRAGSVRVVAFWESLEALGRFLRPEQILKTETWKIGRRDLKAFRVPGQGRRDG